MKVLLINGSPRVEGNTYLALCEIANRLKKNGIESEIFNVGKKANGGCRACGACASLGRCAYGEDCVNELCEKAGACDGFIFGTPVHYASPSADIIGVLDRAFYSGGKNFAYKPAAAVAVARRGGASASLDVLNKYITYNCMPLVSSTYWNIVHGRKPGESPLDEEGMQTMRNLADNMAWLLKSIEAGKKNGVEQPTPQKEFMTSFIR